MPQDRAPAYEIEIDRLLHKYDLSAHVYDSIPSKMARLVFALEREVSRLSDPTAHSG